MTWDSVWTTVTDHAEAAVALALLSSILSVLVVTVVLINMPPDYFVGDEPRPFLRHYPLWVRALATLIKNVLAWALMVMGLVMALPGVPGQGLLTVMVGLLLADFPGKRRMERRVMAIHAVHSVVDRVRHRFGRAPLEGVERSHA